MGAEAISGQRSLYETLRTVANPDGELQDLPSL